MVYALKGNISGNFNWSRMGGVLPFTEWIKGDPSPKKIINLRRKAGLTEDDDKKDMVDDRDIEIESGKYYLAFLSGKDEEKDGYGIIGIHYGLREVKRGENLDMSSLLVVDNETGKWEKISDVLPTLV